MPKKSFSIGYHRSDGDFAIIATLNNKDDIFNCDAQFIAEALANMLSASTDRDDIIILEREDVPDYITLS